MKASLNWIRDYIPGLEIESLENLKEKMISAGLDIESVESESDIFKNIIVGEVTEKTAHPNADKLSLCKVNTGKDLLNIVCGAPNVEAGQKVCVALAGAVIPNGNFSIKKTKIRGEVSEGMICSDSELNISENHEGIKILGDDAVPGMPISDYLMLNDVIFEIGITPNRGDLLSQIGIAREIAAIYDRKIVKPEIKLNESEFKTGDLIDIKIENENLCNRFTGRVIKNVNIKESPDWLKKRLVSAGLRPRNNIVDITNFVMLETGQPLHAFDYDKIRGGKIIVRNAKDGDKFTTLDSKERTLNGNSLMVCDGEGYSGIAGIMGGEHSEITDSTKNVFLECAYFDPVSIRLNSKNLGLKTDASYRFERGVDMENVGYASDRAAMLMSELAGGEVSKGLLDVYPGKKERLKVSLRVAKVNELLGLNLSTEDIIKLLSKIEIEHEGQEKGNLIFSIPGFRADDIEREVDLTEEIARIYGFDNIEEDLVFGVNFSSPVDFNNREIRINETITQHLTGRGFNQVITNSLVDYKKQNEKSKDTIKLLNSVSVEMDAMRTDMINELLKCVRNNYFNSGKDISIKFFETGRVFRKVNEGFVEEDILTILMSGRRDLEKFYGRDEEFDLFDIKGETEMLLSKLNLENFRLFYYNKNNFDGVRIDIGLNDTVIGTINKADSELRKEFEIEGNVFYSEIYLDRIKEVISFRKYFRDFSKFPAVKRDLAIIVNDKVTFDELRENVYQSCGDVLNRFELFDFYKDEKIGKDSKSLAFSLEFVSSEKTLTDEDTNRIMTKIVSGLEQRFGARLRS